MKYINIFSNKQQFLIMVFVNLIIQTMITRYSMLQSPKQKNKWYSLLAFLVALLLIVVMCLPIKIWMKFLVFCLFSLVQGYTLASIPIHDTILQFAFYGALSIFVSMIGISSIITMLGIQIGPRVGLGLFYALLIFLLFIIFNIFTGQVANKLLALVGILLFSIYIVYDTNKILQRDYKGDFISASLDYYLDFLNLFVNISWLNK